MTSDIRGRAPETGARPSVRTTPSTHRTQPPAPGRAPAPLVRTLIGRLRGWMLLPLDALALAAPAFWEQSQLKAYLVFSVLAVFLMTGGERYRARLHLGLLDELPQLLAPPLMSGALVAIVIALRHETDGVVLFLSNAAIAIGLLVAQRLASTAAMSYSRRHGTTSHATVLVGGGPIAAELAHKLREQRRYGLSVVGYVDDDGDGLAQAMVPHLGRLADLDSVVARTGADVLLVADGSFSDAEVHNVVRTANCERADLLVVPRLHHFHTQTGRADHIGSIPVMRIRNPKLSGPGRLLKRAFDLVLASLALVVVSPVMAVAALAVRLEGPGVIFRQQRVGLGGEVFDCLKFRSMRPMSEAEAATQWSTQSQAHRLSPVGSLLRRTSLDELPQLWNIVRGDMSLVGPRPERPHFVAQFAEQYERYEHRHRVKTGLTGLAQVSGLRGDTSISDRARFDNYYIENWSLWLDVKILLRTVTEVVLARGR